MSADNWILISYLLLWVILMIWYQRQDKIADGGSFIILLYLVYAAFSIISYNDPDSVQRCPYLPLQMGPMFFLFGMTMLALWPTLYHRTHPTDELPTLPSDIILPVCWIFILCGLVLLPYIISHFQSGLLGLFSNPEAGHEAYMDALMESGDSGKGITNLPMVVYNMLYDVCVFFFFYLLTEAGKHKILLILLLMSLLLGILLSLMQGQRSTAIPALLTIGMGYFMFQRYYSIRYRRVIKLLGVIAAFLITLPIVAITISRFEGKGSFGAINSLTWYLGQGNIYFCNYAIDDGGTREGTRVFNLINRVLDSSTPANFEERRDIYCNLKIGDEVFSTFVGDFIIDLGIAWAIFVFVVFNLLSWLLIRHHDQVMKGWQLMWLYVTMCICVQGGMLFSYADTAGLKLAVAALIIGLVWMAQYPKKQKEG